MKIKINTLFNIGLTLMVIGLLLYVGSTLFDKSLTIPEDHNDAIVSNYFDNKDLASNLNILSVCLFMAGAIIEIIILRSILTKRKKDE